MKLEINKRIVLVVAFSAASLGALSIRLLTGPLVTGFILVLMSLLLAHALADRKRFVVAGWGFAGAALVLASAWWFASTYMHVAYGRVHFISCKSRSECTPMLSAAGRKPGYNCLNDEWVMRPAGEPCTKRIHNGQWEISK